MDGFVAGFGNGVATVIGSKNCRKNLHRCVSAGLLSLDAGQSRPYARRINNGAKCEIYDLKNRDS